MISSIDLSENDLDQEVYNKKISQDLLEEFKFFDNIFVLLE